MTRLIRKRRIRIVETNTAVIISPALAAFLSGVSHIWHIRENFHEFGKLWPLYSRYILRTSQWVIAMSQSIAEQFPASPKVKVLHEGFDLSAYEVDRQVLRAEFRERFGLEDLPVIGCVGRIKFVRKGQEFLVQAAALLKQRGIRAKYVIAGSAAPGCEDHLERLQDLIASLGVGEDVLLVGEFEDVRPVYAAIDVFTLTSAQPEPFGLVILEAMAMQLPVVATDFGGPREIVEEGVTGYLVPPADPESLAERIALLIANPESRYSMGTAGRERVASRFTISAMWSGFRSVYGAGRTDDPKLLPAISRQQSQVADPRASLEGQEMPT